MRLNGKIVLSAMLVLCLSMAATGYYLISRSFSDAIAREENQGLSHYSVLKYALQSEILSTGADWKRSGAAFRALRQDAMDPTRCSAAVFDAEKNLLYSGFPDGLTPDAAPSAEAGRVYSKLCAVGTQTYQTVSGCFTQNGETVYLTIASDVTAVFSSRRQMQRSFVLIYSVVCAVGLTILLLLGRLIVRPVRQLTVAAGRIAQGEYGESVPVQRDDEIGALADSFNRMSAQIRDNIEALSLGVEQRENFVANFAHELKTPLTSVIGYADMLYQGGLDEAAAHEAAGYILNEGMRLEALSLKLMELIVLDRQDFVLEVLDAQGIFRSLEETLRPIFEQKQVDLDMQAEPAYLRVEFDLFKTAVLNLTDNAIKAGATRVRLSGARTADGYQITVSDDGCGIPEADLNRVTEAFYMADKSRARRQHGAGLGLALVDKILRLHKGTLSIHSAVGRGTTVEMQIPCEEASECERA